MSIAAIIGAGRLFGALTAVVLIGAATWWLLETAARAREADKLQAELAFERAERKAEAKFAGAVAALSAAVDERMAQFNANSQAKSQALREDLIREVSSTNPCFSIGTVRMLRRGRADNGALELPDPPAGVVAPAAATAGAVTR